jgi:hypothetical protein
MTVDVYQPAQVAVPDTHDTDSWVTICSDVIKLANVIHDTEFVPDGLRGSAPAVAAAILAGREMGIGPMTSLQNIHIIKGKPTQSALLMRALVQAAGHKWEDADVTDTRAVVRGCRRGESKWAEVTFTADQAKRAGIDLGKYPQDKLYARASARLCRRKFADVVAGMPYTPDEIEDGEDAADSAGTVTEAAPSGEAPKPAARTARRRTPANGAQAAPQAAPAASEPPAPSGPPLPGEDEDTPEPGNGDGWTGIIQQHFKRLGFTGDDRDTRLKITARLAGVPGVTSTSDLDGTQKRTVADTLARCKDQEALGLLLAGMNAQDGAEGGQETLDG